MTDSPANPAPDDRVTALWDLHFRDPEPAFAQAQALLAEPANVDARTRAWCELTIAFHHLFFTAHPLEAKRWIAAATDSFAKTKPTAFLINTTRGPVVNEAALVHAL